MENTEEKMMKTSDLCKMSLCAALMCVSAYIAVPLPFTPLMITAQTIAVNLTAFILKPKQALAVTVMYILLGAIGLPVFSGGRGGFGCLLDASGGYLLGYAAAAFFVSLAVRGKCGIKRRIAAGVIVGIPVIYAFGIAGMTFYIKDGLRALLTSAVLPFLPGDILKCVIAAYAAAGVEKAVRR